MLDIGKARYKLISTKLSNMAALASKRQQALSLLRSQGLLRPADLERKGLPPGYLLDFKRQGLAKMVARGIYTPIAHKLTENHSYFPLMQH